MDPAQVLELSLATFTSQVEAAFVELDSYSTEALAWLCREHFALAMAKADWHEHAARAVEGLAPTAVPKPASGPDPPAPPAVQASPPGPDDDHGEGLEAALDAPAGALLRPSTAACLSTLLKARAGTDRARAQRYFTALAHTRLDPLLRVEFAPTTTLIDGVHALLARSPSAAVGALLACEHMAALEHGVFGLLGHTLDQRRALNGRGEALLDLHLEARDAAPTPLTPHLQATRLAPLETIQTGLDAFELHFTWWQNLLPVSLEKSAPQRVS